VAIIANSTISENPIGVESIASPASDLKLEAFSAVSRTFIVNDTAVLTLGNGVDEVLTSKNFENVAELSKLAATDAVSVAANFVESREQQLSLNHEEIITASFKFIDNIPLRLAAFEKPDDDVASEEWRDYPGLPIQPIGYSPIASEQFDINFRSFADIAEVGFEVTALDSVQVILNSVESPPLTAGDDAAFSFTNVYEDQGNLGVFSVVSKEIYLNSDETGLLEIGAEDAVQQIFSFEDAAVLSVVSEFTTSTALNAFDEIIQTLNAEFANSTLLNSIDLADVEIADQTIQSTTLTSQDQINTTVVGFDQTSIGYFSIDNAVATIRGKTFVKEYTFLQQEFDIGNVTLKINAKSNEAYVEARDGITVSRQIWIG